MSGEIYSVVESKPLFMAKNRNEYQFVRFEAPDSIVAWTKRVIATENHEFLGILKLDKIDQDNLKFIGVWDKLAKEIQDKLVSGDVIDLSEKQARMEHARKHRRGRYQNVPKQVVCCNCGKEQKMQSGLIVKNAEKWAEKNKLIPDTEAWIKQWKCQKCFPTLKGRKPSHNLPPKVELVCINGCGNKVIYPASVALKFADKKGLTIEKYISGYQCQSCAPSKGRKKGWNKGRMKK